MEPGRKWVVVYFVYGFQTLNYQEDRPLEDGKGQLFRLAKIIINMCK